MADVPTLGSIAPQKPPRFIFLIEKKETARMPRRVIEAK
jgi:hypothetical protein